jgi:hypothetical protein
MRGGMVRKSKEKGGSGLGEEASVCYILVISSVYVNTIV